MRVIGLDPGTSMGWAYCNPPSEPKAHAKWTTESGVWDLSGSRFEGGGMRYLRLRAHLGRLFSDAPVKVSEGGRYVPDVVVFYELVRSHKGTDAAHVYGGLLATMMAYCEERGVPYLGVPVQTIKKRATGKGNARKPDMIQAAVDSLGSKRTIADDEADALWCLQCGLDELGLGGIEK